MTDKKTTMKRNFVEFYSPGTLVSEVTRRPIESWDVGLAQEMAHEIVERHGATPFAFRFITRGRSSRDLDSRDIDKSRTYFLGGKIETLEEVEERNDPDEKILRHNMRGNGYDKILVNTNSWKATQPFEKDDVVLDWTPQTKDTQEKAR